MEDTCSPGKNRQLQTYRIYSIIIPSVLAVLFMETIYIISHIPGNLGSMPTIKALPSTGGPMNSKKV
jgi:hypothetical protein